MKDVKELISGYEREEVRIVVAGDLVHQKIVISNEQLILGTWFLRKLEEIAPVILIAGNHDLLENNIGRMDSVSPMVQFLGDKEISFFKESKCYLDDNIVWCPYSIFEENARPDIESARVEFGDDKTYIGLFHAPLINAKTDIGYEIDHGAELDIFEGCDMVMLGDIHKRQAFNHKGILIAYPSSLIQQNFGENISKHGFLFWDVETKTFTEHDVENKSPYYQFKITSLEDIENGTEKITNL
jgi:DNA repair exonuclease SbcCD nuclease subunit